MIKTAYTALLTLVLLFSLQSLARLTDSQFEVTVSESGLAVTPKKGFHLNAEAPAQARFDREREAAKPEIKKEQIFLFKNKLAAKSVELDFMSVMTKKRSVKNKKLKKI